MLTSTSRRTTPSAGRARWRLRTALGGLVLALLVPLALVGPASARADHDRADRDLAVIRLRCEVADDRGQELDVERTRIHIGCKWRPVGNDKAVGYQLWRIVDRGEREMVARGGLDMLSARDVVPADTKVVRYAVIAVNEDGRRVGQSRVEKLVFQDGPSDRVRPAPVDRRSLR